MNILHVHTRYFPHIDGVGRTIQEQSRELVNRGHTVSVYCAKVDAGTTQRELLDGVHVTRIPTWGRIGDTDVPLRLPIDLWKAANEADLIHTHLPTPWTADVGAAIGEMSRTPTVLTYHNDIVGEGITGALASLYNATLLQMTLRLVDRIFITQPDYVADSNHLAAFSEKVQVIRNGVDIDRFHPFDVTVDELDQSLDHISVETPLIFFLALLDEAHSYKGLDTLLESVRRLAERDQSAFHLLVGGEGAQRSHYKSLVDSLGLDDVVTFLGHVSESDLPPLYNLSDVFVLPSRSSAQEGFGLVLLEALACGTPVITTPVAGIADAIAAEPIGTVVPIDSPSRLSHAIEQTLSKATSFDADRMRTICEREYSWSASVDDLETVYHRLVRA